MLGCILSFFRRKPIRLAGMPRQPREKTYQAESGRIFRYYYLGHSEETYGARYWFEISSGEGGFRPAAVRVRQSELAPWQNRHGRELSPVERYAIAKLGLHAALDRLSGSPLFLQVTVSAAEVEEILEKLGID